jgi:hypothetical protein
MVKIEDNDIAVKTVYTMLESSFIESRIFNMRIIINVMLPNGKLRSNAIEWLKKRYKL